MEGILLNFQQADAYLQF